MLLAINDATNNTTILVQQSDISDSDLKPELDYPDTS
jgi:hypothetical protein